MQASSTQKTKDSAGRRLGTSIQIQESKDLEDMKYTLEISLQGKEVSNGIQESTHT
jgi:hypothetical protein